MSPLDTFLTAEPHPTIIGAAQILWFKYKKAGRAQSILELLPAKYTYRIAPELARGVWPWEHGPAPGGFIEARTMLASEDMLEAGYPGMYAIAENRLPWSWENVFAFKLGRATIRGRCLIFGMHSDGRPTFIHLSEARKFMGILGLNQQTWEHLYDTPKAVSTLH